MRALVLCLILAVAPVAHCQTTSSKIVLPPLPTAAPSPLGAVPVIQVAGLKCTGDVPALGCFDGARRLIAIDTLGVPLKVRWQTYRHEKCHLIAWDSGLHSLLGDEKVEDMMCDAFGTAGALEVMIMAANPGYTP